VAAQLVGGGLGVLPEHGDDQVLGADVGSACLGGDAVGLVQHEPQAPNEAGLGCGGGRLNDVGGGQQGGGELAGLLGGQAAGAQQRRAAGVLFVPLPQDRGQQQPHRAGRGIPAVTCQGAGRAPCVACLLAEVPADHGASFDRQAKGPTAC
jgi:hypothetical protein